MAERLGADYLGFILSGGFGRSVPPERAADITRGTRTRRVAVMVNETASRAAELARSIDASVVQLHGDESPETVEQVRASGDWRVWKAVRARSVEDVARAVLDYGSIVHALLLEGWKEGVTGGGGVRLEVDPGEVRAALPPGLGLVLAGGLTPDTVADAVVRFRPAVVDVSSGVEKEPGRKDETSVARFVRAAREAGRS